MGYSTKFKGHFNIIPSLNYNVVAAILEESEQRHEPKDGYPSIWCDWNVNNMGTRLEWNGFEKTYNSHEWLQFLIDKYIKPTGSVVSGTVTWHGDTPGDLGIIEIIDNDVKSYKAKLVKDE